MEKWVKKGALILVGLLISIAGYSLLQSNVLTWLQTLLLLAGAAFLGGNVAWKSFVDGEFDNKDFINVVTLMLAIFSFTAAIATIPMLQFRIPLWVSQTATWITVIIGLYIVVYGVIEKD